MQKLNLIILTSALLMAACAKQDAPPATVTETNAPEAPAPKTLSAETLAAFSAQAQQGHDVFQYWCATCHGDGMHYPGTMALTFKYQGDLPGRLELRDDLDEDTLMYFVRSGISVMPSFRPTEVSDDDVAAMAAYLQASATALNAE